MKNKNFVVLTVFISAILYISCGSTPVQETVEEIQAPVQVIEPVLSEEEAGFIQNLENLNIQIKKSPSETVVNKPFSSPYLIQIMSSGEPAADYKIKVSYLNNGKETETVVTADKDGLITFMPETPVCGANDFVYFEPYYESDKNEIITACQSKKVSAPYKVKGNIFNKGAILFVWDYNEKDRPVNNSYDILAELRNRGIYLCGNAPVSETTYFDEELSVIYKKNKEIVDNAYGFLIVGQIKFTEPVSQVDDGYLCSLVSEINVIDMSNGNVAFTNKFTNSATGSNWTKCVTKCKKELAEIIVDSIIYNSKL